jgi:hypothetical protein
MSKFKQLFKEWYIIYWNKHHSNQYINISGEAADEVDIIYWFSQLTLSEQWGVYQDFADSLGIHLNVNYECDEDGCYYYIDLVHTEYDILNGQYKTRNEARQAAKDKFEELVG